MNSTPFQFLSVTLLFLATALACEESEDGGDTDAGADADAGSGGSAPGTGGAVGDTGGSGAGDSFAVSAAVVNNYTFTSELGLTVQKVQPNTLLDFDWSQLTTSFLDQPVDPATDPEKIDVVKFPLTPEEFAQKLNSHDDSIDSGALGLSYYQMAGETTANMVDFTSFGSEVSEDDVLPLLDPELEPPATTTYAMMVSTSDAIGQGVQMIQLFQLDETSTETTVTLTDSSSALTTWSADLEALTPTLVPAANPHIVFDWSTIPTTGFGTEFETTQISEVLIARYAKTIQELETEFLHVEEIAEELYRANVPAGSSVDLATLTDEAGNTFPGIGGEGIWLVGLLCPKCLNPTPWYISVVQECVEPCQ